MEVSFSKDGGPAASVPVTNLTNNAQPVPETPTATTLPPATTVTVPAGTQLPATRKFLLGDKLPKFKDVVLPRLNIVANMGELMKTFNSGEIVFNQNTVLYTAAKVDPKTGNTIQAGSPPVIVYLVGVINQRFGEKVEGGYGGIIVDTEEAVRQSGGTLDYKEWQLKKAHGMKRFEPVDDLLMLIERPERVADDGKIFNFTIAGKKHALANWTVRGAAHTEAMAKVFYYERLAGILKDGGYPSYQFALSTRLKPFKTAQGNKEAWVPVVLSTVKTSEDVLKFIMELAGTEV